MRVHSVVARDTVPPAAVESRRGTVQHDLPRVSPTCKRVGRYVRHALGALWLRVPPQTGRRSVARIAECHCRDIKRFCAKPSQPSKRKARL